MESLRRPVGRPAGKRYSLKTTLCLRPEDDALARRLADRWNVSVAEAYRRAMEQAAKRERLA